MSSGNGGNVVRPNSKILEVEDPKMVDCKLEMYISRLVLKLAIEFHPSGVWQHDI